ncbi:class I SAM-dependent methyltransferase [Methanosarcina sp. T3]|uniref:class I SAM-dependent methyltransferase n=1 Tax=Methanosarcina sp. T3 TaxID=3439062 RepID=UPI003F847BCA
MRGKQQPIKTAEGMALVRAIEAQRPEGVRICYDPIARSLVNRIRFTLSKLVIDSGIYGLMFRGVIEFITARERYIDDFLKACLSEGLDQVVILGAGFDTRAYRIEGIEKTRVFEVDHPATQEVKLKRLRKVIDPLPDHVTFVPMDFNTQTLGERLPASGYDEQGKTLFIWQGVTMYLTSEGVDSTLVFITNHSRLGSAVIFDYFYSETLRDMKAVRWITRAIGERLIFGIDEGQIEPFLTRRGFRDIHNATTGELKRLYFIGPNARRPISTGIAIASARVGKTGDQSMPSYNPAPAT